jgi:hypothetical protein
MAIQQQVPGLTRTDLQEHDLSVPGREVIQHRVVASLGVACYPREYDASGERSRRGNPEDAYPNVNRGPRRRAPGM